MLNFVKSFLTDEDGATVVDMTMLMAALVGLSLAITVQVTNGMEDLSGDLSATVSTRDTGPAW